MKSQILAKIAGAFRREREDLHDLANLTKSEVAMLARMSVSTKERDFIEQKLNIPIHQFASYSSYLQTGCKRVWATFRACRLISAVAVSATFKIVREDGEDDNGRLNETHGAFLRNPNPYDSWEEVMEMWVFHMELVGNAYWLKDEVDLLGRPKAIYPLLPQHVKIIPDRKTKVAKYVYSVNGQEIIYQPEEIIHFKSTHPNSLSLGMGSIEPSEDLYNSFINRNTLEEKFMENGAQLSGILVREDAIENQPQWEALKKKFLLQYGGKKNAGKTGFLNGKWNYHKLGMTMAEMQSLEREKWSVEQIFINHGVPLSVAGIEGAANYATSKQDEINFRRYKIVPLIDILVGKLNADGFFRGLDKGLRLAYEMSGLVDVEQIVKEYKPLVDIGAMTRNELREMCNLPVVPNPMLDQFTCNANIIPIEMVGFADPNAVDPNAVDPNADPNADPNDPNAPPKSFRFRGRRAVFLD